MQSRNSQLLPRATLRNTGEHPVRLSMRLPNQAPTRYTEPHSSSTAIVFSTPETILTDRRLPPSAASSLEVPPAPQLCKIELSSSLPMRDSARASRLLEPSMCRTQPHAPLPFLRFSHIWPCGRWRLPVHPTKSSTRLTALESRLSM